MAKVAIIDLMKNDIVYNISGSPCDLMEKAGIKYKFARHHGMKESTYFYIDGDVPDNVPEYIAIVEMDERKALRMCSTSLRIDK